MGRFHKDDRLERPYGATVFKMTGVTCNVVCPGPTDTTLIREMGEQGELPAKIVGGLDRAMPIGRMAQPDEIAYGATVFTHDDALFITGQTTVPNHKALTG